MNRRDDELILYYYGEHETPADLELEMAADPDLLLRYQSLKREMDALNELPSPSPRPGLEGRMWARVAPSLTRPKRVFAWPSGRLGWAALAGTVAAVAFGAFLAGRALRTQPTETAVAETLKGLSPAARERVLQAALSDHLESSQRLLMEVVN